MPGIFSKVGGAALNTFAGRTIRRRRMDRILAYKAKEEALKYAAMKRKYGAKRANAKSISQYYGAKQRPYKFSKMPLKVQPRRHAVNVINPYQTCRSKAVRTFMLNVPGSTFVNNGNYFDSTSTTDLSQAVTMSQCGLSVWWLRSVRSPDYVYLGVSMPRIDIRYVEETNTLTALAALYQYLKINYINLTLKFDVGNVKLNDRDNNNEVGLLEHFTYPSQKGEIINISTATGIMSDPAWEFIKEQGIKVHKTKPQYSLTFKPHLQLNPNTILGSGATIPVGIGNRSISMDDVTAGNIPRMPSPAAVFKLRLPETENAEMSIELRLTVDYKNAQRVSYGFDPTVPY